MPQLKQVQTNLSIQDRYRNYCYAVLYSRLFKLKHYEIRTKI